MQADPKSPTGSSQSFGRSCVRQLTLLKVTRFASVTSDVSILTDFRFIFSIVSLTSAFVYWQSATIADVHRSGFTAARLAFAFASEIVDHFMRQRALAEGANAA